MSDLSESELKDWLKDTFLVEPEKKEKLLAQDSISEHNQKVLRQIYNQYHNKEEKIARLMKNKTTPILINYVRKLEEKQNIKDQKVLDKLDEMIQQLQN